MTTELKVYRRSELEAVAGGCLHRYREIWVNGVDDTSDPALVGIAFHAVKHAYVMGLVAASLSADAEIAQQAFYDGISDVKTPNRLIPEIRQVWLWHSEKWELDLDRFVTAEERGATDGKAFTPDLVYATPSINELEIHDDKSGWQPPMSEDELHGLFQARFYTRYARERWPNFSSYRFTLNAVRFNKSISTVYTPAELDQIEVEVEAHIRTVEKARADNHWPAQAGPSCRFCELECPLMNQLAVVPKRFLEPSQAARIAGSILAAQAWTKTAKKALKGYVSAHGPISVNGVTWANRTSEVRSYPIDVVLETLKMRNIAGAFEDSKQQGLFLSESALAKLFKAYPMLRDDLQNYVVTRPQNRFSAKAEGEEMDDAE